MVSEIVAGPEADMLVAEKLLGLTPMKEAPEYVTRPIVRDGRPINHIESLQPYSTDPTCALSALEVVRSQGYPDIHIMGDDDGWFVRVHGWGTCQIAETLPLAVCRALLSEFD